MTYIALLASPLAGAIIGYFTNCLAIRMLFRPHRPVYLFGIRIPFTPGLVPKEQARLAKKLAEALGDKIITPEALAKELMLSPLLNTGAEEVKKVMRKKMTKAAEYIQQFKHTQPDMAAPVKNGFEKSKNPQYFNEFWETDKTNFKWNCHTIDQKGAELVKKIIQDNTGKLASMFLDSNKIYSSIKESVLEYLTQEESLEMMADKIDEYIDQICLLKPEEDQKKALVLSAFKKMATHVASHIDIKMIIESRIKEFDPAEIENLILSIVQRELHMVMAMGGVLGFIIGWIPVLINLI